MATVPELKKQLDAANIDYPSKALKAELEALVADFDGSGDSPTEGAEASDPAPGVGDEGPTGLTDQAEVVAEEEAETPEHVREPSKKDLVVKDPVLHDGLLYPVGSAAPDDLSKEQVKRLKRLGAIG